MHTRIQIVGLGVGGVGAVAAVAAEVAVAPPPRRLQRLQLSSFARSQRNSWWIPS